VLAKNQTDFESFLVYEKESSTMVDRLIEFPVCWATIANRAYDLVLSDATLQEKQRGLQELEDLERLLIGQERARDA
jgi:hypothetical protein